MMKRVLFALIASALILTASAQNAFEKLMTGLKAETGLSVKASVSGTGSYDGIYIIRCASAGTYIEAPGMRIWYDGKSIWKMSGQEIYLSVPTAEERTLLSMQALIAKAGTLNVTCPSATEIKMEHNFQDGKAVINVVTDGAAAIKSASVSISGTSAVIKVTEWKSNQKFEVGAFICNPSDWPDAEVIDMR